METNSSCDKSVPDYQDALNWTVKISCPFLFVFGATGSVMTTVLCHRVKLQPGMSVYFVALAMADMAVLIFDLLLLSWLSLFITLGDKWMVIDILASISNAVSSWFLVALTAQRTLSVVLPHRIQVLCTHRKSGFVVLAVICIIVPIYCLELFRDRGFSQATNASSTNCLLLPSSIQNFYKMRKITEIVISSLIPSALLFVLNCILVNRVMKSVRKAHTHLTAGQSDQANVRKKKASSLTVMLITVSITFLLLTFPDNVFHLIAMSEGIPYQVKSIIYNVLHLLHIGNSVVHFYLYCLTGNKFREELEKIFSFCRNIKISRND